jgi:hypothetical protein
VLGQGVDPGREFGKHKVCGGLIYTPAPVAACAPSVDACARIVPAPVSARACSHPCQIAIVLALTRVRFVVVLCIATSVLARSRWSCPLQLSREESASGPTHPRPFLPISARRIRVLFHQSAPAASTPHPSVRALPTSQRSPRPRPDQRAHAPDCDQDLYAPAVISRRRPFHPRV